MTCTKMFGQYFHALVCHSPTLYTLICLRSLNTEIQERTFGQCNSIAHQTSNNHPQHVIDNSLIRIQAKSAKLLTSLPKQEAEISQLAKALPDFENTFFSYNYISTHSLEFQSHLERISDYLLPGPGVWWKKTLLGIEFFDGCKEENFRSSGPAMQHFRSSDLGAIEQHLFQCWEECLQLNITLPLKEIRRYQPSNNESNHVSTEEEAEEEISDETDSWLEMG